MTIRAQLDPLIRGIGIAETARRSGVHPVTISRYLAGRADVTGALAERLAAAVGARLVVENPRRAPLPRNSQEHA